MYDAGGCGEGLDFLPECGMGAQDVQGFVGQAEKVGMVVQDRDSLDGELEDEGNEFSAVTNEVVVGPFIRCAVFVIVVNIRDAGAKGECEHGDCWLRSGL